MQTDIHKKAAYTIAVVVTAIALYETSLESYLLFHSMAELFSIIVASVIFAVAWNTRKFEPNAYLLFIGIAYIFIAFIDFGHMLTYKGMGVFPGSDGNLPTQLWITGRYMEAVSLFAAPFFLRKRELRVVPVVIAYFIATVLLLVFIFWGVFPDAFIEGSGLTPFKVASEYIISFILIAAIIHLYQKNKYFNKLVLNLLIWAIITTIASEMAFTLYKDVYGFFNLIGHYLKIVSFYLIYRALIKTNLKKPYEYLVHKIGKCKQAEKKMQEALNEKEVLLGEIHHRVKNNLQIISSLLDLSSMRTQDQNAVSLLTDARSKIQTMSLVYSQIYQNGSFNKIDMEIHIRNLVSHMFEIYGERKRIIPIIEISDIYLSIDQAMSCALVCSELISNALKHAFKKSIEGIIEISIQKSNQGMICIRIKNNGTSVPEEIDLYKTNTLGLKLVRNLVQQQLKGKMAQNLL